MLLVLLVCSVFVNAPGIESKEVLRNKDAGLKVAGGIAAGIGSVLGSNNSNDNEYNDMSYEQNNGTRSGHSPEPPVRITEDAESQGSPAIYENKIVWEDDRNGNNDIYMYDLGPDGEFGTEDDSGEVQITDDPKGQIFPKIHENKIVWMDPRNGNWDIYMYDLGHDGEYGTGDDSEVQITNDAGNQQRPAIYENKIVWDDNRNGNSNIYMYDLGHDGEYGTGDDIGEVRVTDDDTYQVCPDIYGNKIVWHDGRNGNNDIYMYDLGADGKFGTQDDVGEVQITDNIAQQYEPAIHGNKIVWEDGRNGNWDIYMYDLGADGEYGTGDDGGEVLITNDDADQYRPAIYENKIVWQDKRNDNYDIYMYDLGNDGKFGTDDDVEVQITDDARGQEHTIIYKNNIVWDDNRNGNSDIYMSQITNEFPIFNINTKVLKVVPEQEFSKNIKDISSYNDPDGDEPKFSDDTELFDIDPDTGQIDFTPKKEDHGYHKINIKVEDGWGGEAEDSLDFIIDTPPEIGEFPENQTIKTRERFYHKVTIDDPDINKGVVEYSDNTELFDIEKDTGEIDFTPEWGEEGEYEINIEVKQESCEQTYNLKKTLKLKIIRDNYPPEFENLPDELYSEVGRKFEFDINASDLEEDSIEYSDDTELFDINPNTGKIEWIPEKEDAGTYNIEFTVTDGKDIVKKNVTLRVNIPPELKIKYENGTEVNKPIYLKAREKLNLELEGSDEDGKIGSYISDPDIFGLTALGYVQWEPHESDMGKYYVNFSVVDNEGAKTTKMVEINVLNETEWNDMFESSFDNHPPEFKNLPDNLYSKVGEEFEFDVNANDPDDDSIEYLDDTELFDIDNDTGLIRFTPEEKDIGEHNVKITASDGELSVENYVTLNVLPEDDNGDSDDTTDDDTPDDEPSTKNADLNWLILVLGILALVFILGIAIFFVIKRRKTERSRRNGEHLVDAIPPQSMNTEIPPQGMSYPQYYSKFQYSQPIPEHIPPPSVGEAQSMLFTTYEAVQCSICLGYIKNGEQAFKCVCSKIYHPTCGARTGMCPVCQRTITSEDVGLFEQDTPPMRAIPKVIPVEEPLNVTWRSDPRIQGASEDFNISDMFLISLDGLLIRSLSFGTSVREGTDEDIMTGMLTAVSDFIRDSFRDEMGGLKTLQYGRMTIYLERGVTFYLVTVFRGEPPEDLRKRMRNALIQIWEKYKHYLKAWDGTQDGLEGIDNYLMESLGLRPPLADEPQSEVDDYKPPKFTGDIFTSVPGEGEMPNVVTTADLSTPQGCYHLYNMLLAKKGSDIRIGPLSPKSDISKARKQIIMMYHPDRWQTDNEKANFFMKKVNVAWEVLSRRD